MSRSDRSSPSRNRSSKTPSSTPAKGFIRRRTVLLGSAVLLPIAGVTYWSRGNAATIKATLYKNPQCDCCEKYAAYLDGHGFDVTVIPSNDLELINHQHGVPTALDGCHTSLIGSYVVVGHVPVEVVQKLLSEKPDIIGISIPGMPSGTPGMGGPKPGPISVYAFGKSGQATFATV
jgi:hypothetical protein